MKIFDAATEHIKQGGKRRGANMGVLRVDHPDIVEFVTSKLDGQTLRNFNLSVGVTDLFMEAARGDRHYDLIHPGTGRPVGQLRAKDVFDAIANAAWQTGDPGLLFLDTMNRTNPVPHLGLIEATNPCGEIPLLPYESCNLGSINLAHVVIMRNGQGVIDWERLRATVRVAVRFLDDVIAVNRYPIPEIERMTRGTNKIGLGVMGFAEMLIRLGVSYDSAEAVRLAEDVMRVVADETLATSQLLAEERGVFPCWKGSAHEAQGVRVRHATRTAIAPTGTLSLIAGTSASIEPLFALAYRRTHVLEGQVLCEVAPLLHEYLDRHGADTERLTEQVMEKGRLSDIQDIPEELKQIFVTALEIPPERHLQVQAAFQRHVDNAVSKTINLPHDARAEDVRQAYWQAWELGLKGITIYRYGSKSAQVLELGAHEESHHYDHASPCDPEECKIGEGG
jgi:ribonucleoside-diphosphate reductase alpha chain